MVETRHTMSLPDLNYNLIFICLCLSNNTALTVEDTLREFNMVVGDEVTPEYLGRFPYLEHRDNVALALKVCELSGGLFCLFHFHQLFGGAVPVVFANVLSPPARSPAAMRRVTEDFPRDPFTCIRMGNWANDRR